jgi:hypothetical protein
MRKARTKRCALARRHGRARAKFFTYDLRRDGKIVRRGKGSVAHRDDCLAAAYLRGRYATKRWDAAHVQWHASESAALKAEAKKIDGYQRRTGHLPPWNLRHGGGGNSRVAACRASLADGRACRNRAVVGNYGYCGVHAR